MKNYAVIFVVLLCVAAYAAYQPIGGGLEARRTGPDTIEARRVLVSVLTRDQLLAQKKQLSEQIANGRKQIVDLQAQLDRTNALLAILAEPVDPNDPNSL